MRIEYKSNDVCEVEGTSLKYYGFAAEIYCNEDITDAGSPSLIEVLRIDSCKPTVVLEHSVGCPAYTVAGLTKFLTKQFWIPGLSMIFLGLWIMHEGRFWFRSLTAVISFLLFFSHLFVSVDFTMVGFKFMFHTLLVCFFIKSGGLSSTGEMRHVYNFDNIIKGN